MEMAQIVSKRSKDPNTQTGSVVVDVNNQIAGIGYNGWIKGANNEDFPWDREAKEWTDTKYPYVVHCEENAIYCSTKSANGGTLYTTLFPCNECTKSIIQTGIKGVVYLSNKYHERQEWIASRRLLEVAKVIVEEYNEN